MSNLIKIVIIIPCWKRANILSIVMDQLDYFHNATKNKIDVTVLYVFSLNDPELKQILQHYHNAIHTRDLIYSSNEKLGKKHNDGIRYASTMFEYDYIMNFGSDDLIHADIIDVYMPFMRMNVPLFGLKSVWFYEFKRPPLFFSYYNENHIVGAGRMIHRSVIDRVIDKFNGLYEPNLLRGMDTMSANRIMECGIKQLIIPSGTFPYIVDIKSEVNINSFEKIRSSAKRRGLFSLDTCDLEEYFPILYQYRRQKP